MVFLSVSLLQLLNIVFNGVPRMPGLLQHLYIFGPAMAICIGFLMFVEIWRWVGTVRGLRKWVYLCILLLIPDLYLAYLLYFCKILS